METGTSSTARTWTKGEYNAPDTSMVMAGAFY
jgi:hypothetical protein